MYLLSNLEQEAAFKQANFNEDSTVMSITMTDIDSELVHCFSAS